MTAPLMKKLFVTFSPDDVRAERAALQLQTLASIYGVTLELPYRSGRSVGPLHPSTIERIKRSDVVLVLSGPTANRRVQQEVKVAVDAGKVVAVLYEPGKSTPGFMGVEPIAVSYESPHETMAAVQNLLIQQRTAKRPTKKETADNGALLALLGIGLGLWVLSQKGK